MNSSTLTYTDLVAFGVKSSAANGVAVADVQRAFVRAMRAAYPPGNAIGAAATSGFLVLMAREGGSVSASVAAKYYGGKAPVTTEALRKAAKAGTLIGVQDGLGDWLFPVWQFSERGGLLPGLREVLAALRHGHPCYDDLVPVTFFLNPSPHLGGRTPLEAIRAHDIEPVLQQARAAHE